MCIHSAFKKNDDVKTILFYTNYLYLTYVALYTGSIKLNNSIKI